MHCKSCEISIEEQVVKIKGVKKADVSHVASRAKIWYEGESPSLSSISKAVEEAGYSVGQENSRAWFSKNPRDYYYIINAAAILFFLFMAAAMFGFTGFTADITQKSIGISVLVGLVAGVSSCMALVGGLVLALSARYSETHPASARFQKFRPHLFFNLGRIVGFAALGGLIGLVGGALQPSVKVMAVLTLLVGLVMVVLGLKLIEIFPILQRVNITLPKFISKLLGVKSSEQEYSHRGAFVGGIMTFFLPCGFTQAMQLYAISTGGFISGALIMSLFALGTAPGLLGVGGLASVFKGAKAKLFFATAGIAVIALGIFNISNASNTLFPGGSVTQKDVNPNAVVGTVQEVKMTQNSFGYSPNQFTVKKGSTVKWIINSTSQYTCASYITMPKMGIAQPLKSGENIIQFTPTQTGEIAFSCSMGMYRGKFLIID